MRLSKTYIDVKDKSNLFRKKLKFLAKIKKELGEQKIDIVIAKDITRLIEQEALKNGVEL